MTTAERKSDFNITTDTPYLTLKDELWGVYCEHFGENWPCYNSTALYIDTLLQCGVHTGTLRWAWQTPLGLSHPLWEVSSKPHTEVIICSDYNQYGSGHETAAVLLPGLISNFSVSWPIWSCNHNKAYQCNYTPAQWSWSILDSPCPSVCPSVRPSVCRRHGFRSISQVCFGISISNFICMLMVAIGRSLLIFSDVTFKMAAWRPYWIFCFPDSNFTSALNINLKLQRHNTYVYG